MRDFGNDPAQFNLPHFFKSYIHITEYFLFLGKYELKPLKWSFYVTHNFIFVYISCLDADQELFLCSFGSCCW